MRRRWRWAGSRAAGYGAGILHSGYVESKQDKFAGSLQKPRKVASEVVLVSFTQAW